jgi:hypothetical protein
LQTLILAPLAALAACGGPALEQEDVATVESALSCGTGCQEFVDSSGLVHVRVRTCSTFAATGTNGSQKAEAHCPTLTSTANSDWNAGYVLVGGGAEIIGSPVPGALLKTSMPDVNGPLRNSSIPLQWVARSGQYTTGANHSLRAYSIGLRLVGMTADELSSGANFMVADSQGGGNPFTTAISPGYLLLGGGATAFDTPNPMFLTASEPDFFNNGWLAEAHTAGGLADTADPKAVSIGIVPCPVHANGTQWGCLTTSSLANMSSGSGGYISTSVFESGTTKVVTAIGGHGYSFPNAGVKRFITDLIPGTTTQGATIWSKNTTTVAAGGNVPILLDLARN